MCNCCYCSESEEENSFKADVYYYMQEHNCSKEIAEEEVEKLYKNIKTQSSQIARLKC